MPDRPWRWRQTWHDLLFMHWPIDTAHVRTLVPDGLTIQQFDGSTWVGLVPFRMTGVAWRGMPDLPWVSAFPEMNLRLYVERDGKPGVWFVSLDAANSAAVLTARFAVHLPYFWASMRLTHDGDRVRYASSRLLSRARVEFRGVYWPDGPVKEASRGSLEQFLTDRYCLYTAAPDGRLQRLEIQHAPWPLQPAGADIDTNTVAEAQGIRLPGASPILHFSRRLDVVGWLSETISSSAPPRRPQP
jgi:uncharacterized protein YqjF (DUF2071 family)